MTGRIVLITLHPRALKERLVTGRRRKIPRKSSEVKQKKTRKAKTLLKSSYALKTWIFVENVKKRQSSAPAQKQIRRQKVQRF